MGFDVPVSSAIPDGKHEGTLVRFEERTAVNAKTGEEFEMIDYVVKMQVGSKEVELKQSVGKKLGESSKLGKLLVQLGVDIKPMLTGKTVNLDATFKKLSGKKVTFLTLTEETGRGRFARIVEGSLRFV